MKKISLPLKMAIAMIASGILSIAFQLIYENGKNGWSIYARNLFLVIFLQLLITHICAPVVFVIFRKRFHYRNFWFTPKAFEVSLYKFLRVKQWKNKVSVYEDNQFSLKEHTVEEVIFNMCHAEVVHEFIAICSFLPLLLYKSGISVPFLFITSMFFSMIHLRYSIIQRYNRPRLIRIMEHGKNKNGAQEKQQKLNLRR